MFNVFHKLKKVTILDENHPDLSGIQDFFIFQNFSSGHSHLWTIKIISQQQKHDMKWKTV